MTSQNPAVCRKSKSLKELKPKVRIAHHKSDDLPSNSIYSPHPGIHVTAVAAQQTNFVEGQKLSVKMAFAGPVNVKASKYRGTTKVSASLFKDSISSGAQQNFFGGK